MACGKEALLLGLRRQEMCRRIAEALLCRFNHEDILTRAGPPRRVLDGLNVRQKRINAGGKVQQVWLNAAIAYLLEAQPQALDPPLRKPPQFNAPQSSKAGGTRHHGLVAA